MWMERAQAAFGISIQPCSFQEEMREAMTDGSKFNSEVL